MKYDTNLSHLVKLISTCVVSSTLTILLGCDIEGTNKNTDKDDRTEEITTTKVKISKEAKMLIPLSKKMQKKKNNVLLVNKNKGISDLEKRVDEVGSENGKISVSGNVKSKSVSAEVQGYPGLKEEIFNNKNMVYPTEGITFLNSVTFKFEEKSYGKAIPEGEAQTATEKMITNSLDEPDLPDPCPSEVAPCPKSGRGTVSAEGDLRGYFQSKGYRVEQEGATGLLKVVSDHESGGTSTVMYVDPKTRKIQRSAVIGPDGETLFRHRLGR